MPPVVTLWWMPAYRKSPLAVSTYFRSSFADRTGSQQPARQPMQIAVHQ